MYQTLKIHNNPMTLESFIVNEIKVLVSLFLLVFSLPYTVSDKRRVAVITFVELSHVVFCGVLQSFRYLIGCVL